VSSAKKLFEEFDRDHSGALDIDELIKLLSTLGVSTDRAEVALAISRSAHFFYHLSSVLSSLCSSLCFCSSAAIQKQRTN
jgi:hypothetical protein